MKRKFTFWGMLILLFSVGHAQVSLTVQTPPVGTILKNQLWNMVLVSSGSNPVTVNINLVLVRKKDNQPVLSAETGIVSLSKGARQFRQNDFPSLRYTYFLSSINRDPNGLLPLGIYTACYTVSTQDHGEKEVLSEDCLPLEIEPLTPPILNLPADESITDNIYPQLTWLPPAPITMFTGLSYDIRVVEVLRGQSSQKAIQQNLPLYSTKTTVPYINYPASARDLDTGKLYAWKVTALDNGEIAGQSEVWTFRISKASLKNKIMEDDAFYKLGRGSLMPHVRSSGSLKFEYLNDANDSTAAYNIIEVAAQDKPIIASGTISMKYGQNLLELAFPKRGFKSGTLYQLFFLNSRGERWGIMFTYTDTDSK